MKQTNTGVKYAAIIPLIGGMVMGAKDATGQDPQYILSYDAFSSNDSHCRLNFPETPFGLINDDGITWDRPFAEGIDGVDVVVSLCPCAGLSALNSSTKEGSANARGSDAIQNDWMYKSSEYVLEHVGPKVLWGENAPGLYTALGKGVADKLYAIAKKWGYSFSLLKTSTSVHGIPQKRTRSFYFFWKGETAPILEWIQKPSVDFRDYIKTAPKGAYTDKFFMADDLTNDPLYIWLTQVEKKTPYEAALEGCRSLLIYAFKEPGRIDSLMEFLATREDKKGIKYHELFTRAIGKRVWDATPHISALDIPAVVGRTLQLSVHPVEERWLNVQEILWLMGIDENFQLAHNAYQQISQNVPVPTASDWMGQVVKWLDGDLKDSGVDFLKQDNLAQRIDTQIKQTSKAIF